MPPQCMVLPFCVCFLLVSLGQALSFAVSDGIRLQAAPLVGGPSWLPVHVKVVIEELCTVDFVPLNPTSGDTLKKLVTLQGVPAEARFVTSSSKHGNMEEAEYAVRKARAFCENYSKDLHLISNNCWTFAYEVISHVLLDEDATQSGVTK
jgi:hypothetical protein